MDVEGYQLPDELYYSRNHMWVRIEGKEKVKVGVNDFTQKLAGEISYVQLPLEGDVVKKDEVVGTIETKKWTGELFAPVSGKISKVNEALYDDPTLINQDPYGKGWIFEIELENEDEVKELMEVNEAAEWLKEEISKFSK